MNNYILNLVVNSIRYQKKKYLLLFIGIIISVILSNSILLIVKNVYDNQLSKRIEDSGDYDIAFNDVDKNLIDKLKQDNDIDQNNISLFLFETENSLTGIKNLRCDLVHVNNVGFKNILARLEIKQGRLPKNDKEIIIEEWVARRNKLNIGDRLEFNINGECINYEIVGYYNNFKSSQYKEKTNIYTVLNNILERDWKQDKVLNIMFKLKDNILIKDNIEKYKSMVPNNKFEINEGALELQNNNFIFNENIIMSMLLIIPVMIVSIIMILNIFNISIAEKVKYFGTLKMIGASKKDIKKIVILEAILIGIIVFPVGIIISNILVIYVVPLFNVEYIIGQKIHIYEECVLFSGFILIITMIISAYFPANRAAKLMPLDAVFQNRLNEDYIEKSKSINKNKIINNIKENFYKKKNMIILEMANKNIKRNRKKYRITMVSIMLSVFLVIVYSSYFSMVRYIVDKQTKEEVMINTKIYKGGNTYQEDFDSIYNKVSNLTDVKKIYKSYDNIYAKLIMENNEDKKDIEDVLIQIYDDNRLDSIDKDKYFIGKNRNIDKVKNEDGVLIYCKNVQQSKKINYGSDIEIKTDDTLAKNVKVQGVFEYLPYRVENEFNKKSKRNIDKVIIINENLAKKLITSNISITGYDVFAKDDERLKEYQNNISNIVIGIEDVKWIEYDDIRANMDNMLNQINIIIFVFLSFIISIAFLNLLNIISTNIITRRKELGILKSIGLSSRNIKLMIHIEGLVCTIKGSIYGSIISFLFVYLAKRILLPDCEWSVPIWIYVFPVIFAITVGYLATYIPIRKINGESVVELINIEDC